MLSLWVSRGSGKNCSEGTAFAACIAWITAVVNAEISSGVPVRLGQGELEGFAVSVGIEMGADLQQR